MAVQRDEEKLLQRIAELEAQLEDAENLIEAIKSQEVDAFAIKNDGRAEIFTLQSGDYAYRVLIEQFSEGALNLTEDGLIVYTNVQFCKMAELPYEKVIGLYFTDFIHPDSLKKFEHLFTVALKESTKGEIDLLVNNKTIPAYISFTPLRPTLSTVGIVVSDFSEKKKHEQIVLQYQRELEEKNQELVRRNTELTSFAYIASHDLQEPLRKIRTFITRIADKMPQGFPEEARTYFERINNSASRMQELINALLNYSRTNTTESPFKCIELNELLQDVKNNFREVAEANDIVIDIDKLPSITGIPHQFSQLFTNIIGNSIKYRRPNVKTVIKVHAELVPAPPSKSLKKGNYWKIEIEDNGIGFEQKYVDKIFELFSRLHGKSEYEGTGIGLAICKKIVQNHNGYITAVGKPGVGATFTVYLPQ